MGGFTSILGLKQSNQKSSDRYWANFVQNVYDDGVPLSNKKEINGIFRKVLLQENRLFYPSFGSKNRAGGHLKMVLKNYLHDCSIFNN